MIKNYHNIFYREAGPKDAPGFGYSDAPDHTRFDYTFDNLANTMQSFIDEIGLKRFAIYIFDYGAPTGLRLALANPEKITGHFALETNVSEIGQDVLDFLGRLPG